MLVLFPGSEVDNKDGKRENIYKFGIQIRKLKNYRIHAKTNQDYTTGEWSAIDTLYLNWV